MTSYGLKYIIQLSLQRLTPSKFTKNFSYYALTFSTVSVRGERVNHCTTETFSTVSGFRNISLLD